MRKDRVTFTRALLSLFFLLGALGGTVVGAGMCWRGANGSALLHSSGPLSMSLLRALLPILLVSMAGTSTLGCILVPVAALLRGFLFTASLCLLFRELGSYPALLVGALPGFFLFPAFFVSCEDAMEAAFRLRAALPMDKGAENGRFALCAFTLGAGAALRYYLETVMV